MLSTGCPTANRVKAEYLFTYSVELLIGDLPAAMFRWAFVSGFQWRAYSVGVNTLVFCQSLLTWMYLHELV